MTEKKYFKGAIWLDWNTAQNKHKIHVFMDPFTHQASLKLLNKI